MIKSLILKTINFYQKFISPVFGSNCRFYPSCSEYTALVIKKYGMPKGFWKSFKRLMRCNSYFKGGSDLP